MQVQIKLVLKFRLAVIFRKINLPKTFQKCTVREIIFKRVYVCL